MSAEEAIKPGMGGDVPPEADPDTRTPNYGADSQFGPFRSRSPLITFSSHVFGPDCFEEEIGDRWEKQEGYFDYDPYPAWTASDNDGGCLPITRERIQAIFVRLMDTFGFQLDNAKNMYNYLMRLLDSRASRLSPELALRSLHADYIGGPNANYKKWYFGCQIDAEDTMSAKKPYVELEKQWIKAMADCSTADRVVQLALYLLIWGEANVVRFMPECICFLFRCSIDAFYSLSCTKEDRRTSLSESFLNHAITPIYNFYRDQLYQKAKAGDSPSSPSPLLLLRGKDHSQTIGYDDINQTFWYRKSLDRITLHSGQSLTDIPPEERYLFLNQIDWPKSVSKMYYERRTWLHLLTDFNRIWVIHIAVFWYYVCFNCYPLYTEDYDIYLDNQPTITARLCSLSLAGSITSLINLLALFGELIFLPRGSPGTLPITTRILFTFVMLVLNTAPSVYLFAFAGLTYESVTITCITLSQFFLSIFTVIYSSFTPLAKLTAHPFRGFRRRYLSNAFFTDSVPPLKGNNRLASYALWIGVFLSKFIESYFFIVLSLKDPARELSSMTINRCPGDRWIGGAMCRMQPIVVLVQMIALSMLLFFLDTYLWYIIWNTLFSVCRSFYLGVSTWTPWKNMLCQLPEHIGSKIFCSQATADVPSQSVQEMVARVWNSIVISLYREHLISVDHLEKLIYEYSKNEDGDQIISEPFLFLEKDDKEMLLGDEEGTLNPNSEAARRFSFFAHSLSIPMPDTPSLEQMPSFSVLVPHYGEKIILSLQEIVRKEDPQVNITLLEYLKHLYRDEWSNFVRDTKLLDAESRNSSSNEEQDNTIASKLRQPDKNDLPYYSIGFKTPSPEYIMRTRVWASLRTQTLFRTVSGFMNYSKAIKLLYGVEVTGNHSEWSKDEKAERANSVAYNKFRLVTSLQKMSTFNREQEEACEFLMRTYPELQVTYLDMEVDPTTGQQTFYSSLIDGTCDTVGNGKRKPKYKIRLSGNPILGDGKPDNQNHAIIFCRGEYIQLIDANQDNYLEECLKIRSILSEFEEISIPSDVYNEEKSPVAIVGAREYIFSENIGILGDIAAGKEQTFGTLFGRTLAFVNAKLHYGHPDFLNTVFMTTRGGCSKGQKGLHLNEDIYAGMNAVMRSGRIKHCEYLQCGKGRDLGFGSILSFNSKIGSGMAEQMLSREYFYMGTQLPLDRLLAFYYAHPGFHMNNVFIFFSLKLFMLFCVNLAALTSESIVCSYSKSARFTDVRTPRGCANVIPVIRWLQRSVISIVMVFGIAFIPLCAQEFLERGVWKCFCRLTKQFFSLSPMFEVFACRIYSTSLCNDMSIGGARYIPTGRGLATSRVPFYQLYARFSSESFYLAAKMFTMLLYTSIVMWNFSLIYFWCTVLSLLLSPFWFNPSQFSFSEFFLDYRRLLKWFNSGNVVPRQASWANFARHRRIQVTGSKRLRRLDPLEPIENNYRRPSKPGLILTQLIPQVLSTFLLCTAYTFSNAQSGLPFGAPTYSLLRLLIISGGPLITNLALLIVTCCISLASSPVLSKCSPKYSEILANMTHAMSVIIYIAFFDLLLFFQNWSISKTVLGACAAGSIQSLLFKLLVGLLLNREIHSGISNRSWWTGHWPKSVLGWHIPLQLFRELSCKVVEMSMFAWDFLVSQLIMMCMVPILFVPYIDSLHSLLLLWLRPEDTYKKPILSSSKRRHRLRLTVTYAILFALITILLMLAVAVPYTMATAFHFDFEEYLPEFMLPLVQPVELLDRTKGLS